MILTVVIMLSWKLIPVTLSSVKNTGGYFNIFKVLTHLPQFLRALFIMAQDTF